MATSDYDPIAGNNTDINGVVIAEGWSPANVNNALRELLADIATARTGLDAGMITGTPGANGTLATWNADGDLVSGAVPDDAVTTATIADDAVTAAKIAADAVGTSEIAAAAVTVTELADAAVTLAKLAAGLAETTLTDDDTKLATSGGVFNAFTQPAGGPRLAVRPAVFSKQVSGETITLTSLGEYQGAKFSITAGSGNVTLALSTDGTNYGAATAISDDLGSGGNHIIELFVDFATGNYWTSSSLIGSNYVTGQTKTGTIAGGGAVVSLQLASDLAAQKFTGIMYLTGPEAAV